MAFFEVEFFRSPQFKSLGGPGFSTAITGVESGFEQRNRNWANPRRKYVLSLVTPASFDGDRRDFIDALLTFFHLVGGQADPFRFFDRTDFQATSQPVIANPNGPGVQLQKVYSLGGRNYARTITKPITGAVVDFQGNALTSSVIIAGRSGFTVDYTTGIVTGGSVAPGDLATFQFHVPVRFEHDEMQLQAEDSDWADDRGIVSQNSISLIEVRPPNY